MVEKEIDRHDHLRQYCRKLGHEVPFEYCRRLNDNLPCRETLICWKGRFPVDAFIGRYFTAGEVEKFTAPAEPRINQLFDAIRKALEVRDQPGKEA